MLEHSLRQLKLETIIEGCQSESSRPQTEESGYCFELFRRALEDEEQAAWVAIDNQYKKLILHWIYCFSPNLSYEAVEEVVPQTLPKFWRILSQSSAPLTERFGHVGALLKYLKRCAISVLRDHERRMQRLDRLKTQLTLPNPSVFPQPETEQELLARIDREKLLDLVRRWIETYVTDPQEQLVLALSFEQGLTPGQIAEQYADDFADVQMVRRIKERILKRAKRSLGEMQTAPAANRTNGVNGRANGTMTAPASDDTGQKREAING